MPKSQTSQLNGVRVSRASGFAKLVVVSTLIVVCALVAAYSFEISAHQHVSKRTPLNRLMQTNLTMTESSQGWASFQGDGFQIEFPEKPVVNRGTVQMTFRCEQDAASFNLSVMDYIDAKHRERPDSELLNDMYVTLAKKNNYEIASTTPLELAHGTGHELVCRVRDSDAIDVWRVVLTEDRFYLTAVIGHANPQHADTRRFLESIQFHDDG